MSVLYLLSPAKINLFFRVLRKREDGFHEIASLFQAIDLCDEIEIFWAAEDRLTCSDPSLACDGTNLICKARDEFRRHYGLPPVAIHLHKKIPVQSGLGGGSSNAATTLWGLNQMIGAPASDSALGEMGAKLGSDISFFFSTGTAYCTGRGEQVCSLDDGIDPLTGWIIKPSFGLSTPLVYKNLRVDSLPLRDPSHSSYFNDLEISSFELEPRLLDLKHQLLQLFETVVMTGSGTAFFCFSSNQLHGNLKLIQESDLGKASAQNFDQAKPVQKSPPIRNRGDFCRSEVWDAGAAQNQFLNQLRVNPKLIPALFSSPFSFLSRRAQQWYCIA